MEDASNTDGNPESPPAQPSAREAAYRNAAQEYVLCEHMINEVTTEDALKLWRQRYYSALFRATEGAA